MNGPIPGATSFGRVSVASTASSSPPHRTSDEPRRAKRPRPAKREPRRTADKFITWVLAAVAIALVGGAAVLVWFAVTSNESDIEAPLPQAEFQVEQGDPVGADGMTAVQVEDGEMTIEQMAPNSVFIPALGTYMPVEADSTFVSSQYAGFDTLRVPSNARHGVRYAAGAPMTGGDQGTTLIASHVSSRHGWGALRYLYQLRGGELVHTKDGDGNVQTWQITTMRVERHTEFPQEYWAADGARQLVLTTCGGAREGGHFVKNIFAIATPIMAEPDIADVGPSA